MTTALATAAQPCTRSALPPHPAAPSRAPPARRLHPPQPVEHVAQVVAVEDLRAVQDPLLDELEADQPGEQESLRARRVPQPCVADEHVEEPALEEVGQGD